jgi:hypothetical protein
MDLKSIKFFSQSSGEGGPFGQEGLNEQIEDMGTGPNQFLPLRRFGGVYVL